MGFRVDPGYRPRARHMADLRKSPPPKRPLQAVGPAPGAYFPGGPSKRSQPTFCRDQSVTYSGHRDGRPGRGRVASGPARAPAVQGGVAGAVVQPRTAAYTCADLLLTPGEGEEPQGRKH